ncbi:hypothetical protein C0J52_19034 [Blattella germanica]|nr:hypothetical protein C0J52_19034 [Blattella germanica]
MSKKSIKKCHRKFRRKFLCIPVPHKSTIQQLVKKVCETGSFSKKKINRRTVLSEKKLDDIAYLLENSLNKSFSKLAHQAGVSVSSVYKATELLNFKSYKFAFSAPVMFRRKFPDIPVPHKSTIQQLVKKVCETGEENKSKNSFIRKKLDDIAYLLENSPNKSFSKLAHQAGVSVSSVYKATELLTFKSYKFAFSAPVMASVSVSPVYKATKLLNFKPYKLAFSAPVMVSNL